MRNIAIALISATMLAAPATAQSVPTFTCPDDSTMVILKADETAPEGTRVIKRAPEGMARACLVDTTGGVLGMDALTLAGVTVVSAGVVTAIVTSSDDNDPVSR